MILIILSTQKVDFLKNFNEFLHIRIGKCLKLKFTLTGSVLMLVLSSVLSLKLISFLASLSTPRASDFEPLILKILDILKLLKNGYLVLSLWNFFLKLKIIN